MPNLRYNTPAWSLLPTPDGQGVVVFGPTREAHLHGLDGKRRRSFVCDDGNLVAAPVAQALFHPDGRLLTASGEQVRVWDWKTGKCLHTFQKQFSRSARGLVLVAGGKYAVSAHGNRGKSCFLSWNLETMKPGTMARENAIDWMVADDRGETVISSPQPLVWTFAKGRLTLVAAFEGKPAGTVAISADGQRVAHSDEKGVVYVHDLHPSRKLVHELRGQKDVRELRFLGNDRLLSADTGGHALRCWDLVTGKCLWKSAAPWVRWEGLLAVSPDATHVAVAGFQEVALYDVATGAELRRWEFGDVTAIAYVGAQLMATVLPKLTVEPIDCTVVPLV